MAVQPPPAPGEPSPEMREQAEACTGGLVRDRRIREIECRYQGADRRMCVGEPGVASGTVVEAIFQLGRDVFTIHQSCLNEPRQEPVVLRQSDVYSVTDFE
jgi:hypothetical protein